ncbi:hypothetical protein ACSUZJ_23165 [Telluria sp. B2]
MATWHAYFAKQLAWLQDTNWWQMLGYAWLVFVFGRFATYLAPEAARPLLDKPLLLLPLLLIVAKDLAGIPDFSRRMRQVARKGTPWSERLGATLPPEFLAFLKLGRAMRQAFLAWVRRQPHPARPAGTVLTYTERGAYSTVLGIAVFSACIELPIDAAIASIFIDEPRLRAILHLCSLCSAATILMWVAGDRWMVRGAKGHVLTGDTLDLSIGARASGLIPLGAIDSVENVSEKPEQWCKRRGVARRETVTVSPFDAPNVVLRLRPGVPVTVASYQLAKQDPAYVFLYLDRPELLGAAVRRARGD